MREPHELERPSSGTKSRVINLLLLVLTVLISAAILEAGLRIMFARSLDFSMEMWKYAMELKQPVEDSSLSFIHVPNGSAFLMGVPVSINSHGQRDHEYAKEKLGDVYRIVMLGDSTTLGWGTPVEETVAKTLERELNKIGVHGYSRIEVINAGVGNYNTVQEVTHYLKYERTFRPDMVILQYFINDAEPVPTERKLGWLGRSYLLAFSIARFDAIMRYTGLRPDWKQYYAALYEDGKPGFIAAKQALADLARTTGEDGTKLLVTILPELHEINGEYPFMVPHNKIKDALMSNQVPVIDLLDGLRGHGPESTLFVTPTDDHPNGKASSLIVAQILPWVLETIHSGRSREKGRA